MQVSRAAFVSGGSQYIHSEILKTTLAAAFLRFFYLTVVLLGFKDSACLEHLSQARSKAHPIPSHPSIKSVVTPDATYVFCIFTNPFGSNFWFTF